MFREMAFVVPNSWFGIFDDSMVRVIVQASLDGSYGRQLPQGRIFAYGGLFGYEDAWKVLSVGWNGLLNEKQTEYFRTNELRNDPRFDEIREAFTDVIERTQLHVVGCSADMALLDMQSEAAKKRDVFEHVVRQLFRYAPNEVNFALICDREQDLAKQVASWLERLNWEAKRDNTAKLSERIAGICYLNSRLSVQIQAADMVAGLFREDAEQQLANPSSPHHPLLMRLTKGAIRFNLATRSEFLSDS